MFSFAAASFVSASSLACWPEMALPIALIFGFSLRCWAMFPAGISQSPASRTLMTKSRSAGVTAPAPFCDRAVSGGSGVSPGAAEAGEAGADNTTMTIAETPTVHRLSRET